ncbi:AAA family ATPase [Helicobacter saguini]|uniref:AAA family ATPase n=1 Tax=Helicobacter saguini TaxID=1548018 RepID=A0A347VSK2_9HELI|nr:AAA family ATPase [Helicobacter saguini]MWV62472.1 AAA family ATPase [Helicobacter saguini]MWV66855.1 AAA family ATPase [Helicobacter saguini]MWV69204.1 AAA family ATPase [Helicobacter saguini]MWV71241.1 AAA family ATPase [Helicobacter saguini]TLD93292.1 hypothetical protein LS64_008585 [Helicobacter saguini]
MTKDKLTFDDIVNLLKDRGQVFLTGAGGVGKTYSAKKIIQKFNNTLKLATTQIAAQNLNGETLHRVFKLGLSKDAQDLEAFDRKGIAHLLKKGISYEQALSIRLSSLKKILKNTDLIIIDEISMLSAQLLDLIYLRFSQVGIIKPILFIGDLFQLPPVSRPGDRVGANYIFHSPNWHPVIIELTQIQRTEDKQFAFYQQQIRQGIYTQDTHNFLNNLVANTPENYAEWKPTIICATNAQVDSINNNELTKIDSKLYTLEGKYTNHTSFPDNKDFPTDVILHVKVGCRVIFCKNNILQGYYNGLQGVLKSVDKDSLSIETYDGKVINVYKEIFTRYHSEMNGDVATHSIDHELEQFPIRLAYAITIHKSQGMTIEHLHIKFDRIFEVGQAYVAISRASNTKYLKLEGLQPSHFNVKNGEVINYLNSQDVIFVERIESNPS